MLSFYPSSFCAPAHSHMVPRQSFFDDILNELSSGASAYPYIAAPAPRRPSARRSRPQPSTFNPRFDVRETEDAYEFYGELPGLQRENLNIELPDPQTLVVSGHVERSYPRLSNVSSSKAIEPAPTPTSTTTETEQPRRNSYQATVEDDPEDENSLSFGRSTPVSSPTSRSSSPWTELAEPTTSGKPGQEVATQSRPEQTEEEPLYLRQERSVGQFSRTFTFADRVDEDNVTASLRNGILSIRVPKQKPSAPRRIEISL
ncbi:heat shock-like protein [Thermothelomyces thermophilus ATCC 42464]|uniref:Heat shock-like protein n=1 Tax=Thermothelomyces thermophilus (strain ATCC 42464 / BCRC 31852 / DSM 1799) TaxID=573729 RepID=G2PZH9_THET4|nr:heat shock-like protein [Thermothelomyces thermophilus ATCC 42464]AEO55665.1 heat shock-like protein [Thermothelomyces thermophilus ATCC 42464]